MTRLRLNGPGLPRPATVVVAFAIAALTTLLLSQEPAAQKDSPMNAFGKMVPEGYVNKDVRIPSFDANGQPATLLTASTLQRVDSDRLFAEKVHIEIYAADPKDTVKVDLLSATHNMRDQILRSGERSIITRSDFIAEGDALVYDTKTSVGSLRGRVRTFIFDDAALTGKTADPAPAAPPLPDQKK